MFPRLGQPPNSPKKVYGTMDQAPVKKYQNKNRYNVFKVKDVLTKMGGIKVSSVAERGTIIQLTTAWECNLNRYWPFKAHRSVRPCQVSYEVTQLTNQGFNFRKSHEYFKNGILYRDMRKIYGIRMILTSTGTGTAVTFDQIILQLSSFAALLVVASLVGDICLRYVFTGKNKGYVKAKTEATKEWVNVFAERVMGKGKKEEEDDDDERKGFVINQAEEIKRESIATSPLLKLYKSVGKKKRNSRREEYESVHEKNDDQDED